jgi:predicted nucleic acid-binding protein
MKISGPLAEFLIGSGARVSEGVNVRWDDLPHVELARRLDAPLVTIDRRLVRAATGRAGIPDSAENLLSD